MNESKMPEPERTRSKTTSKELKPECDVCCEDTCSVLSRHPKLSYAKTAASKSKKSQKLAQSGTALSPTVEPLNL